MAYYTIAHLLQLGRVYGNPVEGGIRPEDLTEEVFDYVFCLREAPPPGTQLSPELLRKMRTEFSFWYPVDLRCSGKDLIQNHLTMSLFNHAAVWDDAAFWPRAFYCNGHVMVDSEKMSKSKGNFLTLQEAIGSYSADATRIACADSGDGLEDANFSREMCGKSILRLTTLQAWAEDAVARLPSMRTGALNALDEIFNNEISGCVDRAHDAYSKMLYSDALRAVWFDMENLRSQYSILTNKDVHADVIRRLLEVQTLTLSPIAPHFCEHMWRKVLGRTTLVVQQRWPTPEKEVSGVLSRQYELIQETLRSFRLQLDKLKSPKKAKKKGTDGEAPTKPTHAVIFVAKRYKPWQEEVLRLLQKVELDSENNPVDKDCMRSVKDAEVFKSMPPEDMKKVMPYASFVLSKEVKVRGPQALELELPFDEAGMLSGLLDVVRRQLGVAHAEIADAEVEHPRGGESQRAAASPGKPQVAFFFEAAA